MFITILTVEVGNVINQVISYWPSYRFEIGCAGPFKTSCLVQII